MILLFGAPGSGKSVQGQLLAARNNWRWLSAGQLLRDTKDIDILHQMQSGDLVDPTKVNKLVGKAIDRAKDIDHILLDGFPRQIEQAKWLLENKTHHGRDIEMIVVLKVDKKEVLRRLALRGRLDDNPDAIEERIQVFNEGLDPILALFEQNGVTVRHIDGTGTVGQVHDRIMEELEQCQIV